MRSLIFICILWYSTSLLMGQLPMERYHNNICQDNHVHMEGIFTDDRKQCITDTLNQALCGYVTSDAEHLIYIKIDSSGKIAITGIDDEWIAELLRDGLSNYDWEYLHELMTVEIVIEM